MPSQRDVTVSPNGLFFHFVFQLRECSGSDRSSISREDRPVHESEFSSAIRARELLYVLVNQFSAFSFLVRGFGDLTPFFVGRSTTSYVRISVTFCDLSEFQTDRVAHGPEGRIISLTRADIVLSGKNPSC